MRLHLKTLGCRLNEAELQQWAEELTSDGYQLSNLTDADCVIINTCAVTAEGARKSRQQIRRLHRENPTAKIVATGCYASLESTEVEQMLGVDMVVDNQDKDDLAKRIIQVYGHGKSMPQLATEPGAYAMLQRSRDRAFLKIQDGCRYRCTYCIVTVARGEERSQSVASLVEQVQQLTEQGMQEVVLAGVHVGGYGTDIDSSLYELVEALLSQTDIPRVRFASVEPWDLPEHFFGLFSDSRLMPHMHLPLQSGSDSVLRRMSRRCRQDSFAEIIARARSCHPDFNITTDIIVGFPGETDLEWQESLAYIKQIGFGHVHCFSYSDRVGTKAHRLPNKVHPEIKKQRMSELMQLCEDMRKEYLHKQLNQQVAVLWESGKEELSDGRWRFQGYAPNFTRVETASEYDLSGQLLKVDLHSITNDGKRLNGSISEQIVTKLHPPIALKTL